MTDMNTPLSKVRGLGSAKSGTHHWFIHRITAVAQIPLVIFFVVSMARNMGGDHASWAAWLGQPLVAVLMALFIANSCYHMRLGLMTVVEDYVHEKGNRLLATLTLTFGTILLAAFGIFSILRISFGG